LFVWRLEFEEKNQDIDFARALNKFKISLPRILIFSPSSSLIYYLRLYISTKVRVSDKEPLAIKKLDEFLLNMSVTSPRQC